MVTVCTTHKHQSDETMRVRAQTYINFDLCSNGFKIIISDIVLHGYRADVSTSDITLDVRSWTRTQQLL